MRNPAQTIQKPDDYSREPRPQGNAGLSEHESDTRKCTETERECVRAAGDIFFFISRKGKEQTDRNAASDNQKRPDAARLRSSQYTDECGKVWRTHGDPSGERKVYLVWVSADAALSHPRKK